MHRWMDSWDNSGRFTNMLEEKDSGSKEMNKAKPSVAHAWSALMDEQARYGLKCKPSFRFGVQMDAQQLRENNRWDMQSVEEALDSLKQISELPSMEIFISILQKCKKSKNLEYAKLVHMHICNNWPEAHRALGNYLVPMFVECGSMSDAWQIFKSSVHRNEYSWTSLLQGYIECGELQHALNLYQEMQGDRVLPSRYTFVALLKACARLKFVGKGQEIHAEITKQGYERNLFVGSTLVDMYAKCGSLAEAQDVFDGVLIRDVVLWTALIAGYAEHGAGEDVLNCLEQMQLEGISPDALMYVCSLKACGSIGGIDKAREIHTEIAKQGLEEDTFVRSTLVDMYAKCGSLVEALKVFDNLPIQDVVSWTAVLTGYVEHGLGEEALNCLEQMQLEAVSPNAVTFGCSLKACGSIGAIDRGREIHAELAKQGLERNPFVGNNIMDMYAKCGSIPEAREVFDKLSAQDVVSWNALIAGYVEHGLGEEALKCFELMQLEGMSPDSVTCVCILKACGSIGAIDRGQKIHIEVSKKEFEKDPFVGNSLVDMYAKCGSLGEAWEVLDKLPVQDAVSWNALIAGYAERGLGEEALNCLELMQLKGMSPDAITFVCSLKACGSIGALDRLLKVQKIHAEIATKGFEKDCVVGSSLVDMYAKCGSFAEAWELLDDLPAQNVVSWNALIAGYMHYDLGKKALDCLTQMQVEQVPPDAFTFISSLKACGSIEALERGQEIHMEIAKQGFDRDPLVGNSLVDMYAQCGSLAEAWEMFYQLPTQYVAVWNALIAKYSEHGLGEEALHCLEHVQLEEVSPNAVTFVCSLKTCGSLQAIDRGQEIHIEIVKEGLEGDVFVASTLVDMYASCDSLAEAEDVFEKLPVHDVVLWNTLIAGYAEHGLGEEMLNCLEWMQLEGVSPDAVTFVCSLKACGITGAVERGREIHAEIAKEGSRRDPVSESNLVDSYAEQRENERAYRLGAQSQGQGFSPNSMTLVSRLRTCGTGALETGEKIHVSIAGVCELEATEVILTTAVIDMYCKCGSMIDAQQVFNAMTTRNIVTWNALITGYARQGKTELVFYLIDMMREDSIQPDGITFLSALTVCSHVGLAYKGQKYLEAMKKECGITPTIKHHNCMVDLLGRAGQLDEAVAMVEKMPFQPDLVTWSAVLSACQKWGGLDLGRKVFDCVMRLDEEHATSVISVSNIYADDYM